MAILIADKNITLGELIKHQCVAAGYETRLVDNGRDAMAELQSKKYNLLVTDILLPYYTGLELIHYINQNFNKNGPKKIILTQINNEQTVKKSFMMGIDDYVTKPFDIDFLLFSIKKILKDD
jgi:DNA-binding response OmpR family regulator